MNAANPATVLVVEDDPSLNAALVASLKAADYRPVSARSAAEGLRWFADHAPDLVLLDLGLPNRDGLAVIQEIRSRGATPIVVLAARGAEPVKAEALDLGADDFVQKPFGLNELLAHVRTGLRHAVQTRGSALVVRTGPLAIDLGRRAVTVAGAPASLTRKEFDLLSELALGLGRPVSHKALLAAVWGDERAEIQYLRVYMGQLRQKIGADLIRSVQGVGYELVERPLE